MESLNYVHDVINFRAKVLNNTLKLGDDVPYSDKKSNTFYCFEVGCFGGVEVVGSDPENQIIRTNNLQEIPYYFID